MSLTPKKLYQGQPAATATTLYTVTNTTGKFAIVRSVIAVNTDSASHTLTLNHVPSGGTAGAANQILNAVQLPGGTTLTFEVVMVMGQNEFLSALCDAASKVTVTISGVEGP